jgi:hypothetical protein
MIQTPNSIGPFGKYLSTAVTAAWLMIMVIKLRTTMRNNYIRKGVFIGLCAFAMLACDDKIDALVEEIKLGRVLTPVGLEARIRNLTTIELNWDVREGVDYYIVEYSEDSLEFNTIIRTMEVTADDLPFQQLFDGETRYSARVKAVTDGVDDSNWTAVTIETAQENIFLAIQDGDIAATEATLRWTPNSEVTHVIINPGNVQRTITAEEKEAGVATITGLTGETEYTVQLKKDTKNRGSVKFTTLIDVGDATLLYPIHNLDSAITAAVSGDVLVLFPGDYTKYTGTIALTKSISIKGLYPYNKPMVHVQFTMGVGTGNVELRDLELDGDGTLTNVLEFNAAGVDYGSLVLNGCRIHDYSSRLVYCNLASKIASLTIDNCVLTDIDVANSGDFIDFRLAHITSVNITNSTFDTCAPGRDFVRLDAAAGYSGTGLTSTVLIDHCTFYGVSNTLDRVLYVRFLSNVLTVQNSLFAATDGYYSNQTNTSQPACSNNNYFNAIGFYTAAYVTGVKSDISGNHTTLDPGFTDAANGNFTLSNQTLKDNAVGDPRWRQ